MKLNEFNDAAGKCATYMENVIYFFWPIIEYQELLMSTKFKLKLVKTNKFYSFFLIKDLLGINQTIFISIWKMCDANGECDEFLLAHDRVPRVAYVYSLQARTCQTDRVEKI